MKYQIPKDIEKHRITTGGLATSKQHGFNGAFELPGIPNGSKLLIIISDKEGWDHVSVTTIPDDRCPTWFEMKYVKEIFFGDNQWGIQFIPPKVKNISAHENCLHLWRPTKTPFPVPPVDMV